MKKLVYFLLVSLATGLLIVSCDNMKKGSRSNDESSKVDSVSNPSIVEDKDVVIEEGEGKNVAQEETHNSPFDNVEKWIITRIDVTTIYLPVDEEEAKRIEAAGDDDLWVDYDEEEKQWYLHGHEMVEDGKATISDVKWVKRLNQFIQDPEYESYKEDVKIRGKVAYAKWYGGNRGGGIDDDFPKDVANYLNKKMNIR